VGVRVGRGVARVYAMRYGKGWCAVDSGLGAAGVCACCPEKRTCGDTLGRHVMRVANTVSRESHLRLL
jgi:hypothetical protein